MKNEITTIFTGKCTAFRPTTNEIEMLRVGDMAPDAFGGVSQVVDITYRGIDVHGRAYVGYYVRFSDTSKMSGSMKAGEVVRSVQVCRFHTSAEIDQLDVPVVRS